MFNIDKFDLTDLSGVQAAAQAACREPVFEREYKFSAQGIWRPIWLQVSAPVNSMMTRRWWVFYVIHGFPHRGLGSPGDDGLDALEGALQTALTDLRRFERDQDGTLTYFGQPLLPGDDGQKWPQRSAA